MCVYPLRQRIECNLPIDADVHVSVREHILHTVNTFCGVYVCSEVHTLTISIFSRSLLSLFSWFCVIYSGKYVCSEVCTWNWH